MAYYDNDRMAIIVQCDGCSIEIQELTKEFLGELSIDKMTSILESMKLYCRKCLITNKLIR